jgi:alpha-ribazole phosphatase/probable phosphoglycerate mutase
MLNVYLLRHGETTYNADGLRYCGITDAPLTEKGKQQAATVAAQIKDITFDAIYSSPLSRAYDTATIAASGRPVIKDERLIEANFGQWEGKRQEEFVLENPLLWETWMKDPCVARAGATGETGMEVVTRVNDFFEWARAKHENGTILVVGHNAVNRFYLAYKMGVPLKNYRRILQLNSSITMFTLDEQSEIVLRLLNSVIL